MPAHKPFHTLYEIDEHTGCWLWTGSIGKAGYGLFHGRGKLTRAHRASYEMHCGAIPSGMVVMHSCDTPRCVNPAHLSVGTQLDNIRDRDIKGRARGLKGSSHSQARLNETIVSEIRASSETHTTLAARYGVTPTAIMLARTGRTWRHV